MDQLKPNPMEKVKAKKHLGQHFLTDKNVTAKIASIVDGIEADRLIEIGPGMGVLTELLFPVWKEKLHCVEIDRESVKWLKQAEWAAGLNIIDGDFLQLPDEVVFAGGQSAVIGNYPYNISTQIAFRVLEHAAQVPFFGGMFQCEVAKRFCADSGNKEYGITSVLLQAYYHCDYCFTVNEGAFQPAPKVKSGVISCRRKAELPAVTFYNLKLVVKTAFNQRRKTLSNALKPLLSSRSTFVLPEAWKGLRAEQLSVADFVTLASIWERGI